MRFYNFQTTIYPRTKIDFPGFLLRDSKYNHIHPWYHHRHNCIGSNFGKEKRFIWESIKNEKVDTELCGTALQILCQKLNQKALQLSI